MASATKGRSRPWKLAGMYKLSEQYTKAEAQWKEIVTVTKAAKGPYDWSTFDAMKELAEVHRDCGNYGEENDLLEEMVQRISEADLEDSSITDLLEEVQSRMTEIEMTERPRTPKPRRAIGSSPLK